MQQPYPDHFRSDIAIVIQLVQHIWPLLDDIGIYFAGPDRKWLG